MGRRTYLDPSHRQHQPPERHLTLESCKQVKRRVSVKGHFFLPLCLPSLPPSLPVMAIVGLTLRPVTRETKATVIATPADGPS